MSTPGWRIDSGLNTQHKTATHKGDISRHPWYPSVLFVPATPKGELASMINQATQKLGAQFGWQYKVVEKKNWVYNFITVGCS